MNSGKIRNPERASPENTAPAGRVLHLGDVVLPIDRPLVMGILNVTPDSFSDGGLFHDPETALRQARRMIEEGAGLVDVGAESTRPGSGRISAEEELDRLLPVIEPLLAEGNALLSVDTSNPRVADTVLRMGVPLINDVRGLRNPDLMRIVGDHRAGAVIMHMQGEPETMQKNPQYGDVVREVRDYLVRQAEAAKRAGIREIIIDPGIGFGKTVEHNLALIARLAELKQTGYPVCLGVSRKSFIGKLTGTPDPMDRLEGTIAANVVGLLGGADILRVHDVRAAVRTVQVLEGFRHLDPAPRLGLAE